MSWARCPGCTTQGRGGRPNALHARARWTLVIRVVPEPRSPGRPASRPIRPEWKNADVIRPGGPVRRRRLRTVSSRPQATIASTSWSLPPSTKSAGLSRPSPAWWRSAGCADTTTCTPVRRPAHGSRPARAGPPALHRAISPTPEQPGSVRSFPVGVKYVSTPAVSAAARAIILGCNEPNTTGASVGGGGAPYGAVFIPPK